jgi:transcriptional regulator
MYIQDKFREERLDKLHAFMRSHSLATIVVSAPRLEAFLMPVEIAENGAQGLVRGHVIRTNPLWTNGVPGSDALAVFQGANSYISPRWYVNGQRSGRVAPSWNFSTVHASGPVRFVDDPHWVRAHLASLAALHESHRDHPWRLDDAPVDFIDGLIERLVGVEIEITHLEGKFFLSQQRTPEDRASIVKNLADERCASALDLARDIESASPPPSS